MTIQEAEDKIASLQKFKDYVHDRLDKMGIEKDPDSEHKAAGCRIGGRLDIVEELIKNANQVTQLLKIG